MTNVEKMRRYIELTGVTYSRSTPYQMNIGEMMDLRALAETSPMDALCLAKAGLNCTFSIEPFRPWGWAALFYSRRSVLPRR